MTVWTGEIGVGAVRVTPTPTGPGGEDVEVVLDQYFPVPVPGDVSPVRPSTINILLRTEPT